MHRIVPILMFFVITYVSFSQELVNDVVGASGNEISNADIIINDTSAEMVVTTIGNSDVILTQGFQQTAQIHYLQPKALLQGAILGTSDGLMRDDLRLADYIPEIAPDNEKVIVSNNALNTSGNNAIVDWVTINVRNSNFRKIISKYALIQRDGDIVSADGISPIQITAQNNDYYVEIDHRNHLGVMSKNEITLSNTPLSLDFTGGLSSTYGANAQVILSNGTSALWAGDTGNTEKIVFSGSGSSLAVIRDYVLADPANIFNSVTFPSSGYLDIDVDLNGIGRFSGSGSETSIIRDNVLAHPGNIFNSVTYPINGTVPPEN